MRKSLQLYMAQRFTCKSLRGRHLLPGVVLGARKRVPAGAECVRGAGQPTARRGMRGARVRPMISRASARYACAPAESMR